MLERTLHPRKTLQILFLAAFATLAFLFAGKGRYPHAEQFVAMVGVLFCAVQLLPGAIYLKLTRNGFEYKNIFPRNSSSGPMWITSPPTKASTPATWDGSTRILHR
jgi:hypothetical protein